MQGTLGKQGRSHRVQVGEVAQGGVKLALVAPLAGRVQDLSGHA